MTMYEYGRYKELLGFLENKVIMTESELLELQDLNNKEMTSAIENDEAMIVVGCNSVALLLAFKLSKF